MRQVSAVHYEDLYPKSFIAFRKKYLPLLKKGGDHRRYYVQFTNFMDDTLSKKPYENPDHHDPVAIYGYPLEYVLKHPADVWYGNQAKYLRVLTERKSSSTLLLQYMTESGASNILYKMGLPYDSMDKARLLWPDRIGKGTGSVGRAFFQAMQMDMSGIEKIPRSKDERKALAESCKVRSGKEQTALLRKAGFDAIEDTARNQKTAVINPREPEQIAFLHRNAFDVVEVIPLKLSQKKEGVGTAQNPSYLAPKLAAMIATRIDDRIVDKDDQNRTFWTAAGREITISFDRPSSYYEGKKLGEKKHKESKLHSTYLVKVSLASERGTFSPMAMASEKFTDLADDVADRFNSAEPVEGFKPISRASRASEKEAATKAYRQKEKEKKYEDLKRWTPERIEEIAEVAQRLGLPFTQAEYFNSSDEARELLDDIIAVVGRGFGNEMYRARNRLQEEDPKAWDWYSKYDREKALNSAKESISYLAEDVNADPSVAKEISDIYETSLNWMLDNKKWSYQAPAGFFGWMLRDMKESEPEAVSAASKLVADAAELLESIPVYSAMEYVSTTQRPNVPMSNEKARRLVLAMKEGNQQAANVIAKWLVRKHPKLLNFKGIVAPAARSTKERKPHMHFANALLNLGVGSKVVPLFERTKDLPSSRGRRRAGLPGATMEEHLESLAVMAPPESGGVLIVDDVITSGAMLKASVRALKRAGFKGPFLAATAATTVEEPRAALSPEESSIRAATVSGYLVNDVIQLRDYLLMDDAGKGYEIAWNAWPMFVGWAEDTQPEGIDVDGLNANDKDEAETNIDSIPQAVFAAFWDWFNVIENTEDLSKYVPPAQQPTFLFMEFERVVKGEWLVHFSDKAGSIATNGFKHGVGDVTTLGLTTHFINKPHPGFNFAYLAKDAARWGKGVRHSEWKYGKHAVMFKANGVLVYHHTDQEPQVIFLGSTAKDIVELENTDDGWVVIGKNGPVFKSDDYDTKERKSGSSRGGLQRCIDWVETNYNQYRNKLNQQEKAVDQKTKQKIAASLRAAANEILASADKALFEVRTNFPEADMWVIRKGTLEKVGSVTKTFSPENIGVKVLATDIVLPDYLYYVLMHLHMKGFFKSRAKGTTNLQNITVKDVNDALGLLRPAQVQAATQKLKAAEAAEEEDDKAAVWNKLGIKAAKIAFTKMKAEQIDLLTTALYAAVRHRNPLKKLSAQEIAYLTEFFSTNYSDKALWAGAKAVAQQAASIEQTDSDTAADHMHAWLVRMLSLIPGAIAVYLNKTDKKAAQEFRAKRKALLRKTRME